MLNPPPSVALIDLQLVGLSAQLGRPFRQGLSGRWGRLRGRWGPSGRSALQWGMVRDREEADKAAADRDS